MLQVMDENFSMVDALSNLAAVGVVIGVTIPALLVVLAPVFGLSLLVGRSYLKVVVIGRPSMVVGPTGRWSSSDGVERATTTVRRPYDDRRNDRMNDRMTLVGRWSSDGVERMTTV